MTSEQDLEPEDWSSADTSDAAALDEALSSAEDQDEALFEGGGFDSDDPYDDEDAPAHDIETRAMAAAERALSAGHAALEAAQAAGAALAPRSLAREWVLRGLLAFNLLLMAGVLLLPNPEEAARDEPPPAQPRTRQQPVVDIARPPEPVQIPDTDDRYTKALLRAAAGDLSGAVQDLEDYLAAEPRMLPAMKRNVLSSLAHYSFQLGFEQRAREFDRRAAALTQSNYLPEDLIEMARRAEQEGDGVQMRRLYARFLLQQKQVPPSMHRFLAEAYLELGDSYRVEADRGAERTRKSSAADLQPVVPDRGRDR